MIGRRALAGLPAALVRTARAEDALLQAVLQRLAAEPSRAATFVQQKQLASLTTPLTSRGRLDFVRAAAGRPLRLEMRTEAPRPEHLLIEGDSATLEAPDQPPRTLPLDELPELRALADALRATLAGDFATLSRVFTVETSGSVAQWRLMLVPTAPLLRARLARVTLDGTGGDLRQVTIQTARETDVLSLTPLPAR